MSEYKKKANFKDSIISGIVVLLILIAGVVLIIDQFSEVDLSKKELEELRSEVRLAEVELIEKQDKWEAKVIRDTKSVAEQEEELNSAWENFEREKAKFKEEISSLKIKYKSSSKSNAQIRREVEREVRSEYKKSNSGSKDQKELNSTILKLEAKNELLQQELAEYTKLKKQQQASKTKAASIDKQKKAKAQILALMNEFAAYDVDLKKPNWCDKDYSERFYKADAKLEEIKKVMKQNGLQDSYKSYLANASRSTTNEAPDGWCNGVKM